MFATRTQPHALKAKAHIFHKNVTCLDQLSPAHAVRADTVDDLGQVDSSGQVIPGHEGSDSDQVVVATRWIHLFTQSHITLVEESFFHMNIKK